MLKISLIAAFILVTGVAPALADHERLTLDQAAKSVERETNGRVLDARPCDVGGRPEQCFKVLTRDGRVRRIYVDPQRQLRSYRPGDGDDSGNPRRNTRKRR
ncbi:MAG: hypothetical protein OEQ18_11595 [Gammaproteobacteria bacterium]|nr:hypothetical protein [Gammaproteobacteria bacterium]